MDCQVQNANYARVTAIMEKFLEERYRNGCSCPRCLSDITALALNYLPPHYYAKTDDDKEIGSPWVMVETAVLEAMDKVLEHPHHFKNVSAERRV